jgi:hypothetical protein
LSVTTARIWKAGLIEDYAHYRRGEGISTAVKEATGLAAGSFRDFAEDYRQAFL